MFFKQVQHHGDNFSYVIGDDVTKEAVVVDSSYNADEILKIIKNEKLQLKYIINTHEHSDHTSGNIELSSIFGAKTVGHRLAKTFSDIMVDDGDSLFVGKINITIIYTPGHSIDSICLLINNQILLTGDTLFVGECGRTDLRGGNARSMYESLFDKILKLNDAIVVYPGHDYGNKFWSTIGEEKVSNYTLRQRSLREFLEFMSQP